MSFIAGEIDGARRADGALRCRDGAGRPLPGAAVSVIQVDAPFQAGVRWWGEPPRAVERGLRLGGALHAPGAAEPPAGAPVIRWITAPQRGQSLRAWQRKALPLVRRRPACGWVLDLGPNRAARSANRGALACLRGAAAAPVMVAGLALPPGAFPPGADGYGVTAGSFGAGLRHAVFRRTLVSSVETLGPCFVHDLRARPAAGLPSLAGGGWERHHAEELVALLSLCFSVGGISGVVFSRLSDRAVEEHGPGLLAADERPKRAFKVLRALLTREWRTRTHGVTDAAGRFAWRGFHGAYDVTVTLPCGVVLRTREVLCAGATEWDVECGAARAREAGE